MHMVEVGEILNSKGVRCCSSPQTGHAVKSNLHSPVLVQVLPRNMGCEKPLAWAPTGPELGANVQHIGLEKIQHCRCMTRRGKGTVHEEWTRILTYIVARISIYTPNSLK